MVRYTNLIKYCRQLASNGDGYDVSIGLCLHFSGNMGGNLRDLEAVMGVEYIRRKENKMNGEKEIAQMGREEAFSCFFISLSLGSRKRESHPITGGHQTYVPLACGALLSLGSLRAHSNNYMAPLSEPVIVYGRAAMAHPAVKIKGCK